MIQFVLKGQGRVNKMCSRAGVPWFRDLAEAEKIWARWDRAKFQPHLAFPEYRQTFTGWKCDSLESESHSTGEPSG